MSSWTLQQAFKRAIETWYVLLGFIILGGLVAMVFSSLSPAPYRASADLYVGIDITRVNEMEYLIPLAKEEPLNLDDYKNWQLKQLSDILFSDRVLMATLASLEEADPIWEEVSLADFRNQIDIYWYDTGIWRLEVVDRDREKAEAAVKTWLKEGHQFVSELQIFSEQAAILDAEIEVNKDASTALKIESARVEAFQHTSEDWLKKLASLQSTEPLNKENLDELAAWLDSIQMDVQGWVPPLNEYPTEDALVQDYQAWLEAAKAECEQKLEELQIQLDILADEREQLLPEYHDTLDDSLGLSANIVLNENTAVPVVTKVRNEGTTTLAGAGFGLIGWLIFSVIQTRGSDED